MARAAISYILIAIYAFEILNVGNFEYLTWVSMKLNYKERHKKCEECETYKFNKNEIAGKAVYKHAHEFELYGEMYDIIEEKIEDGQAVLYCKKDSEEIKQENKIGKSKRNKAKPDRKLKKIKHTIAVNRIDYQHYKIKRIPFANFLAKVYSGYITNPSHPPEIFACKLI